MSYGFDSPYQPPEDEFTSDSMAADKIKMPAIGIIATAAIGMILQLINMLIYLASGGVGIVAMAEGAGGDAVPALAQGVVGMGMSCFAMAVGAFIIFGAVKMIKLESYNLAMAASILVMIPCLSPCCILGLPLGIWSLVTLLDENNKRVFQG